MAKRIESIKTSLEIDEQLPMHERGWTAQTVGLTFIFLLIATAAIGLYGDGVASKETLAERNVVVLSQRFYRFEARMELKVNVTDFRSRNIGVSFDNKYLEHFQIDSILPEPAESSFSGNMITYIFPASGNAAIRFFLIPKTIGKVSGTIKVNETTFQLNHFIYP